MPSAQIDAGITNANTLTRNAARICHTSPFAISVPFRIWYFGCPKIT